MLRIYASTSIKRVARTDWRAPSPSRRARVGRGSFLNPNASASASNQKAKINGRSAEICSAGVFILTSSIFWRTSAAAESPPALLPEAAQQIDAAAEDWRAKSKAPGLSIAIVRDDRLIWSKGYGLADVGNNVAAQSDTVYRLASLTKSLTAVAVMQLVEEGKLELDAPIQKYVPLYPGKRWTITPRQLLTHTAGMCHNRWREKTSTEHYATVQEAINVFKDDELLFEPGTKYSYSTQGYVLLGGAIERASGMPYLDYLREHIIQPAGMAQTTVDDATLKIPDRAVGYRKGLCGFGWRAPRAAA